MSTPRLLKIRSEAAELAACAAHAAVVAVSLAGFVAGIALLIHGI